MDNVCLAPLELTLGIMKISILHIHEILLRYSLLSVVHNLGVMRHVYHVSTGDWRLRVSGANVANTPTHSLSRDIGPVATAPLSTLRQNNINQTTTPE